MSSIHQSTEGQVLPLAIQVRTGLSEQALEAEIKETKEHLGERLDKELRFMASVCELDQEQIGVLNECGRRAIDDTALELTKAVRRLPARIAGGQMMVVVGRGARLPTGAAHESPAALDRAIRELLALNLQEQWPGKSKALEAEQQRLDLLRRRAGALAKIAEIDEALLLTGRQRAALCEEFLEGGERSWQSASAGTLVDVTERYFRALAGGEADEFSLSAADWERILGPSKLAAYKTWQLPLAEEVVYVRSPRPKPAPQNRAEMARLIARLPEERWQSLFSGWQLQAVLERLVTLVEIAAQFEVQRRAQSN